MRYSASGRVLPERANVNIERFETDLENSGKISFQCEASQFALFFELGEINDVNTAHVFAGHWANFVVGALGFANGCGYGVEVVQIIDENSNAFVFGVQPIGGQPGEKISLDPLQPIMNRALSLSLRDLFFRLAIRDYMRAMNDPIDCPTYCFRAIESVKASFVFKTGKDRWDDMHKALGTSRDEITTTIKDFADPIRHGSWPAMRSTDNALRWKMLILTRDILRRYLDLEIPSDVPQTAEQNAS